MSLSDTHYDLYCINCGSLNHENETTTYCTKCGGVLAVRYEGASDVVQFPLKRVKPDPLKTTQTELRHLTKLSDRYGVDIYAKLELQNPTGCFKDRGSNIEIQKALEMEKEAVCVASTGNMAASVAAYSSYYNLPCYVFVPEKTPEAKLAQAIIYGANVLKIKGDFSTCEALCRKFAGSGNYYLAGDYVFREEGQKSFSFELLDQGGSDFDYILIPVGCGTNFAAIWKGLKEAHTTGRIDKTPRLVAIQPEQSSPVVEGIIKKKKIIKDHVSTIAGAVAAADPVDFYKVFTGIEESDGLACTVSEEEILISLMELAEVEGIFAEPAAALPLAALKNNTDKFKNTKCLLVITGTGLKDTAVITRHSLPTPILDDSLEQVQEFVQSGFLEMQKKNWGKSHDTVVANLKLDPDHEAIYKKYLERFNKKGKTLTPHEIEVLQSLIFNEETNLKYPVEILDYDIRMKKDGLVSATVSLKFYDRKIDARAKGVGPLDAVLGAVKSVTDPEIPVYVKNHNVEIISPASNSLVVVSLTLEYRGKDYVTRSASPDTIEAGLNAFIKGLAVVTGRTNGVGKQKANQNV